VPENFHVLTKEEFKKSHKSAVRYQNVIVDEAHYFLGMKSALSKALHAFLKATKPNILMLTATPYRSSPWDVYRLLELLDHPTRPSYWRFSTQCFSQVRMGGRMIPVQRKGLEPILAEYIRQVASIVKLEDCIDVPDQIHEVEYFSLTEEQNDAIAASYDPLPIVRFTKIHQICGGTLKGDEYNDSQIFISEKLARMIELVESNPRMIVVCRYKSELRMLHEYFKQAKPKLLNGLIDGDVSGPEREAILSSFRNKDSYVLFVNASCAEGWELSDCPLMVFYSMDFSLLREIQMRGRIQRINNIKKNTYLYLVVEGTIDEDIYECVTVKKRDFHLAIYEKEGDKR
jgi:superfamily II DNA or RNA helicase